MTGRLGAGQAALRTLVVAGTLGALLATGLVGPLPAWWLVALVGVLSLAFAAFPESPAGAVAFVLVLAWWGVSLRAGLHPEALLAATGLLVAHVAALVAAYGPARMPLDRAVALLWLRRGATAFLVAPGVWVLATLLRGQPEPPGIWVVGLVAACVATLVASASFRTGGRV